LNAIASDAARMRRAVTLSSRNLWSGGELAAAAGQVIAHRMSMGVSAMVAPHTADHAEFARMVPEKLDAFADAGAALLLRSGSVGETMLRYTVNEAAATSKAILSLATARTPAALVNAQVEYAQGWFDRALRQCWSLGMLALHAQSAAIAPIHRKATHNARRLASR
jgi:hypothetical protein